MHRLGTMNERPLSALRPGDRATIGHLEGGGPIRRRLLELGLTPGTEVTLVRLAPLRDPMEIRVRGYQLCVRRSEADAVWVLAAAPDVHHGGTESRRPEQGSPAGFAAAAAALPDASCSRSALFARSVAPCLRVGSLIFAPLKAFCSR